MVMDSLQRLEPPMRLGKLTLLARLGEGGMASVYVASVGRGSLARLAAVKLLRSGIPDHDYKSRFLDEAKVVVRLHHNNIVDVREAGEVDDRLYIAMELIEGRDLADVWDRCATLGRAFPVPLAIYMVREILRGLHYAHTFPGLGLVHRDISPSNILVDWAGAVRLADFGLATSAMKASLTVPGLVFGKVGYMAPEQATREELDARADVYGCGVVLWELLTGRPLREGEVDTKQVAKFVARRPGELSKRVDTELDAIVMRALARDRNDRFLTALDFMKALSGWLGKNAPETTQDTVAEFMMALFGEARAKDHEVYTSLLDALPHTGVWDRRAHRHATHDIAPPAAGDEIPVGTVLVDKYRVERELGQGGMGIVYLAEHLTVGRKVAVKVLTHEWSRHDVVALRFKEEARAASAAGHPNIVEVFDAGTLPDGRLYIVMEYLTGRSLFEEVMDRGVLPPLRSCRIVREIARAVAAAHEVGIIHRDLKPDNVMLMDRGDDEVIKVLDFGISASAVRSAEEQRLTRPGHCLGTPEYMAPEQAIGAEPAPTFDIYAIGVLFYEMLTGEPPFVSQNMVEVLTRKATERAPPLLQMRPDVPPPLAELIDRCVEMDPAKRPQTIPEFLGLLTPIGDALAQGLPISGMSGPRFERALDAVAGESTAYVSAEHADPFDTTQVAPNRLPLAELENSGPLRIGDRTLVAPNRAVVAPPRPEDRTLLAPGLALHQALRGGTAPATMPGGGRGGRIVIGAVALAVVASLAGVALFADDPGASAEPTLVAHGGAGGGQQSTTAPPTPTRVPPDAEPTPPPLAPSEDGSGGPEPETGVEVVPAAEDSMSPEDSGSALPRTGPKRTPAADTGERPSESPPVVPKPAAEAPEPTAAPAQPPPVPKSAPEPDDCGPRRAGAEAALDDRRWHYVLTQTASAKCWRGGKFARDRIRYRVTALLELHRWDECLEVADGVIDDPVERKAKFCRMRKGHAPS